jgi:MEMO1 family protein
MGVYSGKSSTGDMSTWGVATPPRIFPNDREFAAALLEECAGLGVPASSLGDRAYALDHGVMVPMHFIAGRIAGLPVVPLTFSWLPLQTHFLFGKAVQASAKRLNRRLALIASGDLSHRLIPGAPAGYDPKGKEFDKQVVYSVSRLDCRTLIDLDPEFIEKAGECGLRSIVVLLGALDGLSVSSEILSYEGPFGVGYLVAAFDVQQGRHPLAELARQAVETVVRGGQPAAPTNLTEEMKERAGVFVCLKKHGQLRGCIGTFEPTRSNVAAEVIANSVSSASRDPRFSPVSPSELSDLEYTVDVLTKPEPVGSPDELDAKKYGVIVESGGRRGLLLPDLEGVDSVAQQIEISRQKAGIPPGAPVKLYRFEVRRYK